MSALNDKTLIEFTELYLALLDSNDPTQDQLDVLTKHKFIEPRRPDRVNKYVSPQVNRKLKGNISAFDSPYQIDKKLGIEFEAGLTQKWPMNTAVALIKITEDESHIGYIAIASDERAAAIIKDKSTEIAEIHLHGSIRKSQLSHFISNLELSSNDQPTREGIYVNKSIAEKNAVFEVKSGHASLNEFFKTKFPEEASEIENFDKVIDRLVNRATIASVSGLQSGEVNQANLKLAVQLQDLLLKTNYYDSVSHHEARAVEDLFAFRSEKHVKSIGSCFSIDTDAIRTIHQENMNRMDIHSINITLLQAQDKTMFVLKPASINMYKPGDSIEEIDGMTNDEHTFQIAEMMHVGNNTITLARNNVIEEEKMNEPNQPTPLELSKLKDKIIMEMDYHLEILNEFIDQHYTAKPIVAPPALAEFVDDMAGYSFVASNTEFAGVELVEIWNHYEDHFKRSTTPLLAAVLEDLSANHDTRAYDFDKTLERALSMVNSAEPEEPEQPQVRARNKIKI